MAHNPLLGKSYLVDLVGLERKKTEEELPDCLTAWQERPKRDHNNVTFNGLSFHPHHTVSPHSKNEQNRMHYLGSRISLISKKNIRYEGTLYSINETDATVALQTVRAYGTEGRESENETFVPAQDAVHPYLLFRGCDIKDLHVHESTANQQGDEQEGLPSDPAIVSAEKPDDKGAHDDDNIPKSKAESKKKTNASQADDNEDDDDEEQDGNKSKTSRRNKTNNSNKPKQMVGSGASLLRRKARGVVDGDNGKWYIDRNHRSAFCTWHRVM